MDSIYEHKIQYYETDQMKIVHHSNYIRWFEEARIHMLEVYNMGYALMEERGIISPVLSVSAEYKSMSRFGETVQIETKLTEYKGLKYKITYIIKDKATGIVRCIGESRHCFLDGQNKPLMLKRSHPDVHEVFEAMLAAAEE